MQKVLLVGVIVLPLVLFLAFFADNIMTDTSNNSDTARTEAQELMDLVTE